MGQGLAVYVASHVDASLRWEDVRWLSTITNMPVREAGRESQGRQGVKRWW